MAVLSLKEREVRLHLPVDNKDRVIYKKISPHNWVRAAM